MIVIRPIKIFVSYTLRDKRLTLERLIEFKEAVNKIKDVTFYVDIIDNKNKDNPQGEVIKNLEHSDIVWLVNSEKLNESIWVQKELSLAENLNKPIYNIEIDEIINIIKINDTDKIKECLFSLINLDSFD